jgi:homoserine kinase type II
MDERAALPAAVLARYDLGEIHAVAPKSGGWMSACFVVTCQRSRYFFKRRPSGCTPAMVACDHDLICFLVDHAFPTPAVVPARDGHTWVEWKGQIHEAYAYVAGKGFVLGDCRQMSSLGRTVARYHCLVAGYRPLQLKLPPWGDASAAAFLDLSGYVTTRLEALRARDRIGETEARFVHQVTHQLRERAEVARDERELISLTVHGALEPGNVLFGPQGEVVAWVDWADSGQFVRAYDVAHALLKFGGRRPDAVLPGQVGPMLPRSSVEAFATAYRQEIRLTAVEGALLPWLMLACRIVDALWTDGVDLLIDHRRELHLAQELYAWLMANAAFLQEAFC